MFGTSRGKICVKILYLEKWLLKQEKVPYKSLKVLVYTYIKVNYKCDRTGCPLAHRCRMTHIFIKKNCGQLY